MLEPNGSQWRTQRRGIAGDIHLPANTRLDFRWSDRDNHNLSRAEFRQTNEVCFGADYGDAMGPSKSRYSYRDSLFFDDCEIPIFTGWLNSDGILEWIKVVDEFFEYWNVIPEKQAKIVAKGLRGKAKFWWKQLQYDGMCYGKQKIKSWAKMKIKFINKFLPRWFNTRRYCHDSHRGFTNSRACFNREVDGPYLLVKRKLATGLQVGESKKDETAMNFGFGQQGLAKFEIQHEEILGRVNGKEKNSVANCSFSDLHYKVEDAIKLETSHEVHEEIEVLETQVARVVYPSSYLTTFKLDNKNLKNAIMEEDVGIFQNFKPPNKPCGTQVEGASFYGSVTMVNGEGRVTFY